MTESTDFAQGKVTFVTVFRKDQECNKINRSELNEDVVFTFPSQEFVHRRRRQQRGFKTLFTFLVKKISFRDSDSFLLFLFKSRDHRLERKWKWYKNRVEEMRNRNMAC